MAAIADRRGLPVAVHVESAYEVTLVHATLAQRFVRQQPVRLAWFQNFRRLVVRYEKRVAENFLGMAHLACCVILLRGL